MRSSRVLVVAALAAASLPRVATAVPAHVSMTPASHTVVMHAGQSTRVDYALTLPAQPPRPTDVYLLVDTGPSMRPHFAAVRGGLVAAMRPLVDRGVRVGLGEFRTTSAADWTAGVTYRALRRVGAVDHELERAFGRLGSDDAALPLPGVPAHTVALDEAVTGDGHSPYVEPGGDAGFRPGARRVVVVVTAAAFAEDPTQPSRDDAVARLRAAGAEVFGLAIGTGPVADLAAVAAGTGSVADTTVDCGASRIAPGRPTACAVASRSIGEALSGMLYERRRGQVTVSATGRGVRRLAPRAWSVDLNKPARLTFGLDVACAAGDAGRTHEIVLAASAFGRVVSRSGVTVVCR